MTASVAARLPIPFDGIEDLRLAVDEACAWLLARGRSASAMTLRLRPLDDRLEAEVSIDVADGPWPPPDMEQSLPWRILSALVDTLSVDTDGGRPVDPRDQADARALADDMSSVERPIGSTDREVETELFQRLPDDAGAREQLVRMFLPLAEYLARRFDRRGEPLEDLVQVASVGLLNAIDRFDVQRDVQFSTYAAVTIIGELKRHFRDKGWAIRVPRRLQEVGLRVNAVLPELSQELGRSPTVEEIAARCEASPEEILDAMEAVQAYSTTSLDSPVGEEGAAPIDVLGGDDPSLEILEGWASVAPAVKELPERERGCCTCASSAGSPSPRSPRRSASRRCT